MSALTRVVRSGLHRRRVQTVVVTLATAAAVTSGVLGLGLLVASNAPFDHAFAAQHGAHLTVMADPAKVTADQLTATADVDGVAEATGPFRVAQVMMFPGLPPGATSVPAGARGPVLTVVARTGPGSGVDRLTLTEGRWATQPDEVVMPAGGDFRVPLGDTVVLGEGSDAVQATVVGLARSVSVTADAWMTPDGLDALHASSTGYQMLYRLADASTAASLSEARDALSAALPAGAVASARSWLTVKHDTNDRTSLFVPILLMFGGLSLMLSVLIVGTVVAGAVGSTIRHIGILKALGFTPAEVVRSYVAQALVPATAGALAGVVAGNLIAVPLLADTEDLYGTVALTIAPWVDGVALLGVLAVVTATASVAAGRAGRLSSVDALAVGRTPTARRGQRATRVAARLPLPRPVTLGLARPFSAPARTAAMVLAVAFGAAAVTLATGLATSLNRVQVAAEHSAADVIVNGVEGGPPGAEVSPRPGTEREPADPGKVAAALESQPGTAHWLGYAESDVVVPGLTGKSSLVEYTSNPGWVGYELVSGRWFTGPGEAVVPTELLRSTDRDIGDTLTLTRDGESLTLTIVGEVFDPGDNDGLVLTEADAGTTLTEWLVGVSDGTDPGEYADALQQDLDALNLTAHVEGPDGADELVLVIDALAGLLTLMLVTVAGLGVLNAVVLDVRDRVHDIGIHKALGMTPRQTLTAVLSSVVAIGLVGGLVGVPAGVVLHGILLPAMARGAGVELPEVVLTVFGPMLLTAFVLGGVVLAVAGALLPAGWAARTRTATALRTE
jgi:putative ABC transport system permease protein